MSCCQVARSNSTDWAERSAPAASHSPMRRKIPSPSATSPPVDRARRRPRTGPARRRRPAGARAMRSGRSARRRTPSGSRNREYCDGNPGLGQRQHRPRVPEHAGIGVGLLAQVRDGPAVPELHRVQSAAGVAAFDPRSPSPPSSHPRRTPRGRQAAPARPGTGSPGGRAATSPTSGSGSSPFDTDHSTIPDHRDDTGHPCGRSTYLRMAKSRHAHALGGPHLPRPDPPDDRRGSPEALRPAGADGLRRLRPVGGQPPRGQPACSSARCGGSRRRATGPSPSPEAARA